MAEPSLPIGRREGDAMWAGFSRRACRANSPRRRCVVLRARGATCTNAAELDVGSGMIRQSRAVPYWRYGGARCSKAHVEVLSAHVGMHAGTFIEPERWRRASVGDVTGRVTSHAVNGGA